LYRCSPDFNQEIEIHTNLNYLISSINIPHDHSFTKQNYKKPVEIAHFKISAMKRIIFIVLTFFSVFTLSAQQWKQSSDPLLQGKITSNGALTIHKGFLFFLKDNSIYKSADSGVSWKLVNSNLNLFSESYGFSSTNTLSSDGNYLFTSRDYYLLRSEDGINWSQVNNNFYRPVLLTTVNTRTYIKSSDSTNVINPVYYLWYTDDSGVNWTKGDPLSWNFIFSRNYPLAFHNLDSRLAYTYGGGNLTTIDSHLDFNGRPPFRSGKYVFRPDFYIDANDNFQVSDIKRYDIATAETVDITASLDTIVDYGYVDSILFLKTKNNNSFKVLRSLSSGDSWETITSGEEAMTAFIPGRYDTHRGNLAAGSILITLSGDGFEISKDTGRTWQHYNNGLYDRQIVYSSGSVLFTGSNSSKLIRSIDHGVTWEVVSFPEVDQDYQFDNNVRDFFSFPNGDVIARLRGDSIFRSTDHGNTWTKLTVPYKEPEGTIFYSYVYEIHEVNNKLLMRIIRNSDYDNYMWTYMDYVSEDGGKHWSEITDYIPLTGYLPTEKMFYKSNGTHLIGAQFPDGGSEGFLLISSDNGLNWQKFPLDSLLPSGLNFSGLEHDGQDVYLTAVNNVQNTFKLYKVLNNGSLVDFTGSGAPEPVYSVFRKVGSVLYAANAHEFKMTADNGHSWEDVNGLPFEIVKTSLVSVDGALVLGTENGVWIGEDIITALSYKNNNSSENSLKVYPNPANEHFTVSIANCENGRLLQVVMYDVTGQEIKRFIHSEGMKYPVADLKEGIYTLNFIFEQNSISEKIVLK
jgi:hypothetical protein